MRILVLHLSDIHLHAASDPVLQKAADIGRALRELESNVDSCYVAVSGDVTQRGEASEYAIASAFFNDISAAIKETIGLEPVWVVAPGNHDAYLPDNRVMLRETLLEAARRDLGRTHDAAFLEACCEPQRAFFDFLKATAPPARFHPLVYDYEFEADFGRMVFRCINTAWISERNETPGKLMFPTTMLPEPCSSDTVVVTVFHHPSNWLEPDNRRDFARRAERASDLVLTGHEHDAGSYLRVDGIGACNEYVEGDVLQDRSAELPGGFNIIVIDTDRNERAVVHFKSAANGYMRTQEWKWQRLHRSRSSARRPFEVSESFSDWLNDPELRLTHGKKDTPLSLRDVFVWPEFREVSYTKKLKPLIGGETLLLRLERERRLLITGADKCGKTTVCKEFFRHLRSANKTPVLLRCSARQLSAKSFAAELEKAFVNQYSREDLTLYRQLDKSQRAIIIDDLHLVRLSRAGKVAVVEAAQKVADIVIVTADDLAKQLEDLVYSKESSGASIDLKPYRIHEFGHVQRYTLAEKWLSIGVSREAATDRIVQEWPYISQIVDTIIGKNFVPSHPLYLLSVLQAREASRPVDLRASTYGYFFEIFVKEALAETSRYSDPITKREYLVRLARHLFDQRRRSLSENELRAFHAGHETALGLHLPFAPFIEELQRAEILTVRDDDVRFSHTYAYYYFVASSLSDHIGANSSREVVRRMCGNLHVEEFANVMLFLAHLSRDPFILDTVIEKAKALYVELSPATLTDDIAFIAEEAAPFQLQCADEDVSTSRRNRLSRLDDYDDASAHREFRDDFEPIMRLNTSLKTLQILGQIVRNFAGALDAEVKVAAVSECYALGLRMLSSTLGYLRTNRDDVFTDMFHILRREHPEKKDAALLRRAEGAVFYFAQIIAFGVIKKVSAAVGSERLNLTYKAVRERMTSPAVDLIDMSLRLDHSGEPPERHVTALYQSYESTALVAALLRDLVVHHFDLFDVQPSTKQKICSRLKIDYNSTVTVDNREILVASPKRKLASATDGPSVP